MARQESKVANKAAKIEQRAGYHGSSFEGLKLYTSDRYINLNPNYERPDGKLLKAIGIEMETEVVGITDPTIYANIMKKVCLAGFPSDMWRMERDESLGGDCYGGLEVISQTMTKEAMRNLYKEFKTMYEYFQSFGISTENEHCGMHVNVSLGMFGTTEKTQYEAIRKLFYFVNHNYEFCKVAFNRTNSTCYCAKMNDSKQYAQMMNLFCMPSSHGNCMNYSHIPEGRIEIRLVGGQKNYPCFRNTMEVVFHLIEAVKKLSWDDMDDLSKVFAGCNKHVFDRLKSNCYRAGVISMEDIEKIRPTVDTVHSYL